MEETTIAFATAVVLMYDDGTKKWISPNGCNESCRSHVMILQNAHANNFRIVATRTQDGICLLNFNIFERLKYRQSSPLFHQWRDEKRKVFGLNFVLEEEARNFMKVMMHVLATISSSNDYQNGSDFGLSNGVYQEPQQINHPSYSNAGSFRDNDTESMYSANLQNTSNNLRKSSHSVITSGSASSNPQQRRASQGSSSSNGSSSVAAVNIPSIPTVAANRIASVVQSPANTIAASGTANGSAAPPPPPPLPPVLSIKKYSAPSMADQLKNVQLRKVNSLSSNNSGPSRGRDELVCELEERLNKRKNQVDAENGSNNDGNGSSLCRPWEKQSSVVPINGASAGADTSKTHRNVVRVPSGSSLSSQEEQRNAGMANVANCGNSTDQNTLSTNGLSMYVLDSWKRDLLNEVKTEINNAKLEIMEMIRSELSGGR